MGYDFARSVMHRYPHRTTGARWARPALALLVLSVTAEAVCGQELEIFLLAGRSDNAAFGSYSGIGIATSFTLQSGLRLRAALDTESSSLVREGRVCNERGFDCALESGVLDETRRAGVSVTLHADLALSDRVRLSAAAGPYFSKIAMDATSVTQRTGEAEYIVCDAIKQCKTVGRIPLFLVPKTLQLGAALMAEIQIRPVPTMPWVVSAGWGSRMVNMDACTDQTGMYAPFCGWDQFNELRLGVGFVF